MNISACSGYGNSGIEGLTYYKDGKVLAGAQANSHLFLCDLSTKKVIWDKMLWSKELISEIGGMCYDPLTDWLWLIDSEAKKIFVVTVDENDGTIGLLGAYSVKDVANPESVCVDHKNSCVWVGDDLGDETSYLFRYDFTGLDDAVTKR
jgi:outer membrane protein assembly factor BamB